MNLYYEVIDDKYINLKSLLKEYFFISDRFICKLKREKRLNVNNESVYINKILEIGDVVNINIDFDEEYENIVSTKMDLDILYEDEALLIVDKKQGIAVHPSAKHYENTLANGVKYYFEQNKLKRKIRIVNRLDKDTSRYCYICKK